MNLLKPCIKCLTADGIKDPVYMSIEMGDGNVYDATCPRGHKQVVAIPLHKHELLFEIGAMALQDGYPREAVVSLAASLERLYELCVKVVCDKSKIDPTQLASAWKHLSNSSERQFGAYVFASLMSSGKCPPTIDAVRPELPEVSKTNTLTWTAFRNAVVHKGYIPSGSLVMAYCEIVYTHINTLTKNITAEHGDEWLNAAQVQADAARATNKPSDVELYTIPTLLFLARGHRASATFADALKVLTGYRHYVHAKP